MKVQIFPILKPEEQKSNINKTRPITLLECPRKIMFKILNNQLSMILVKNIHILGFNNFAALLGKSTIEPLHRTPLTSNRCLRKYKVKFIRKIV